VSTIQAAPPVGAPTARPVAAPSPAGQQSFLATLQQAMAGAQSPAASGDVTATGRPPSITLAAALGLAPAVPVPVDGQGNPVAGGVAVASAPSSVGDGWKARLPAAGQRWADAIESAATKHGLDPRLLAALVRAESGFRADARSHAGAVGLTQLMPATARGLGVDPHDPVANLDGGARYLKSMLDRFGSAPLALAAYNAGPGRVERAGGIPNIAETRAYVPKVLGYYEKLR
jgi:soluble lytic murein transglycosylase-like protein